MQSRQRQASNQQLHVPPVPTTMWHQLASTSQQHLAHLVAQLIQRVRVVTSDKEQSHER